MPTQVMSREQMPVEYPKYGDILLSMIGEYVENPAAICDRFNIYFIDPCKEFYIFGEIEYFTGNQPTYLKNQCPLTLNLASSDS